MERGANRHADNGESDLTLSTRPGGREARLQFASTRRTHEERD